MTARALEPAVHHRLVRFMTDAVAPVDTLLSCDPLLLIRDEAVAALGELLRVCQKDAAS